MGAPLGWCPRMRPSVQRRETLQDKRGTETESQSLVQLKNSFPPLSSKALPHLEPVSLATAFTGEDEGGGGCWNRPRNPFHSGCQMRGRLSRTPSWKEALLHQVTAPLGQPLCSKRMPPTSYPTRTSGKGLSRVGASVGSQGLPSAPPTSGPFQRV